MNLKYQEYTNTEILNKVNEILNVDEYKNFSLAYVLKVKDESQNCYAVAMDGDKIIGFNPFENEIDNLPDWDFNIDSELFKELEWNREIIYMLMECHYGIWNEVSNYYPEDIEHKEGMQEYLKYCKDNNIDKQYLEKKLDLPDVPDVMKYYEEKTSYTKIENGQVQIPQEKYLKDNEVNYIVFCLGYDLLNDRLSQSENNECDLVFDFCNYLANKFVETDYYKNEWKSTYDNLREWLEDNKENIKSEYLCYFKLDDKLILETGERRGTPVALVKRENEQVKEYIIAFNYEITDNKVQWGYGYYYDQNIEKAKADFEKVKAGGNLADTFDVKNNETTKKDIMKSPEKKIKNKNRDVR